MIGSKIRAKRIEKGFSTIQIADMLNISESTYRRIENDKARVDISMLDKFAEIFEVPIYELLPEKQSHYNYSQNGGVGFVFASTFNHVSEKLIEQYEERIKELQAILEIYKNHINKNG